MQPFCKVLNQFVLSTWINEKLQGKSNVLYAQKVLAQELDPRGKKNWTSGLSENICSLTSCPFQATGAGSNNGHIRGTNQLKSGSCDLSLARPRCIGSYSSTSRAEGRIELPDWIEVAIVSRLHPGRLPWWDVCPLTVSIANGDCREGKRRNEDQRVHLRWSTHPLVACLAPLKTHPWDLSHSIGRLLPMSKIPHRKTQNTKGRGKNSGKTKENRPDHHGYIPSRTINVWLIFFKKKTTRAIALF